MSREQYGSIYTYNVRVGGSGDLRMTQNHWFKWVLREAFIFNLLAKLAPDKIRGKSRDKLEL